MRLTVTAGTDYRPAQGILRSSWEHEGYCNNTARLHYFSGEYPSHPLSDNMYPYVIPSTPVPKFHDAYLLSIPKPARLLQDTMRPLFTQAWLHKQAIADDRPRHIHNVEVLRSRHALSGRGVRGRTAGGVLGGGAAGRGGAVLTGRGAFEDDRSGRARERESEKKARERERKGRGPTRVGHHGRLQGVRGRWGPWRFTRYHEGVRSDWKDCRGLQRPKHERKVPRQGSA